MKCLTLLNFDLMMPSYGSIEKAKESLLMPKFRQIKL
jgi:hypothetical protein